jgi:hypothetical protein
MRLPMTSTTPALATTTSGMPQRAPTSWASAFTEWKSVTSHWTGSTVLPSSLAAFTSTAADPSPASSTSARTTFIPDLAHSLAIARPIPLAAPVTTAVLSESESGTVSGD